MGPAACLAARYRQRVRVEPPPAMRAAFSTAMGQALLLPGIVVAMTGLSVLFLTPHHTVAAKEQLAAEQVGAGVGET